MQLNIVVQDKGSIDEKGIRCETGAVSATVSVDEIREATVLNGKALK